jgi:glycosyltransferase involved in cell wall biosynthesis
MRPPSSLQIAVADSVDPRDMQAGSGVSGSLVQAFEELAGRVVALDGGLPARAGTAARLASATTRLRADDVRDLRSAVRRLHTATQLGRPTIAARWLQLRRELAQAGELDAVIQRGCEMRMPGGRPVVTFEDSTVLQAWEGYPWPHLQALSERDIARYAGRQRAAYGSAVACCCATHWVAESIVGSYGIPRERVFTVGLGQNHEAPAPAPRDWSVPRYLFVGVDWERKNGPAVLAAFAQVREQHPEARLDVVGGHPRLEQDGVVGHGLLSLVQEADRARLAALFAGATTFVMPSLHEPAGIVYIEAGGAGVPSIGTTAGGAATMIGPGGLTVDPLAPAALVRAMRELADPQTARRLGELAREHSALFTWRKVAERLLRASAIPDLDTSGLADFL